VLKLALDVHLLQHVVAMQYNGSPKPLQRFTPKDFLAWVQKQMAAGWRIISCHETGPFGYGLHRQLAALGVPHHVIRPGHWDDGHKGVKTDRCPKTDDARCIEPVRIDRDMFERQWWGDE
jgi:hypothetical protein